MCLSNGLKRTDMCRLQDCEHQASSFESDDEESADGDIEELTNEYDCTVILDITYDLSSWTLHVTCFL